MYEEIALARAKKRYPIGMVIPAWSFDRTSYLKFWDPTTNIPFVYVCGAFIAASMILVLAHYVTVCCFGYRFIFEDSCGCRMRDPYR